MAQGIVSLLRIYASLADPIIRCQWALFNGSPDPVTGEGPLGDLPKRASRVQLVVPAAEVLIARTLLPGEARHRAGPMLAFAIEELLASEPDANQVTFLGAAKPTASDADRHNAVLAVCDKKGLESWRDALNRIGIWNFEIHSEFLLLPYNAGEWSFAWNGREGFARTGELEGIATDCGDRDNPPLTLRFALDEAKNRDERPESIAIHVTAPDAAPNLAAWQHSLGVALHIAGRWDWRTATPDTGVSLLKVRRRWSGFAGLGPRLRPAAWVAIAALTIHAAFLAADWAQLVGEQRALRVQMEARFRAVFPDAVAVVDPSLQMRRKLAEARHAAGQADDGDFLPLIERVASGMKELPPGSLRIVSYESGRLTLELAALDEAIVRGVVGRLLQAGLMVDPPTASGRSTGGAASAPAQARATILTVRQR